MSRLDLPIGVFDSGVGGLTVLGAIRRQLPTENLLYLGDTARVPYGARAPETVRRYATRVAGHLYSRGIKALVIACNTATTWALDTLEQAGDALGVPVVGVIQPGVDAAVQRTRNGHVAIIGTEGTVMGGRYTEALRRARPDIRVSAVACPLFVSLAEEGWTQGEVPRLVAERYLAELRDGADTLILGCTHYPMMTGVISETLPGVQLVDSGQATAGALARVLEQRGLLRRGGPGRDDFLVTDNLDRFHRVARHFLGSDPEPARVVDLDDADGDHWSPPAPPADQRSTGGPCP